VFIPAREAEKREEMKTYQIGEVAQDGGVTAVTKYWASRSGARAKQVNLFATDPDTFWLIGYEHGKGFFLEAENN